MTSLKLNGYCRSPHSSTSILMPYVKFSPDAKQRCPTSPPYCCVYIFSISHKIVKYNNLQQKNRRCALYSQRRFSATIRFLSFVAIKSTTAIRLCYLSFSMSNISKSAFFLPALIALYADTSRCSSCV